MPRKDTKSHAPNDEKSSMAAPRGLLERVDRLVGTYGRTKAEVVAEGISRLEAEVAQRGATA